jgi:hypothetical protein
MSSNLKRTLMDVRKMRRAVRMRQQTDPEVVSKTLETILHEAIALSTSGDGAMSKAAIKELRQVRKSMLAGQVDAGQNTAAYIGSFSAVLDQIDDVSKEAQDSAKEERTEYRSTLMENLPSSDTVISAIMTANPLLGYSIKIGRDLMTSSKRANEEKKQRDKLEAQKRKERLEQQEQLLLEQLKTDEMQKENATEEHKQLTQRRRGIYRQVLEEIRDELKRLDHKLSGEQAIETSEGEQLLLERLDSNNDTLISSLESNTESTNTQLEKIDDTNNKELQFIKDESAFGGLTSAENVYENKDATFGSGMSLEKAPGKGGGFLSNMMGGLMGLGTSLMSPFVGLLGFLKTAGTMLLKFGKFGVVLAAFKGIYDFVDGIFRANEILGETDIDWKDRLKVGLGNVLSGLLEPINWLTKNLFDMDLMGDKDRDDMTRQYFEFFDNFTENIIGMAKWIWDSISGWLEERIDGLIEDIKPDWWPSDKTDEEQAMDIEENAKNSVRIFRPNNVSLEEVVNPTGAVNRISDDIKQTEDKAMTQLGRSGGSGATVVAPSSNQTNVNNHQYNGSSSSESKEPTHRRFSDKNSVLAW